MLDSVKMHVPSCSGIESRRGCGFQSRECDSVDDNERCNCVGFRKNACMHVGGLLHWVAMVMEF